MSSIEKLMIRGIRSFNPNSPNTLQFYTPLTLIVGPNGTGKTTIIECLKYITTGDMPPNSKGGAFIYDPKIAHEVDVKAQIKLKFVNTLGQTMVCTRSLQLTQKKTKLEQRTLESLLWTKNAQGEQISISSKCADMDKEIPLNLGVTKAILENVIFCHQEESSWPLSEPGTIKKKLDDIFASTQYSKALDSLKSLKRDKSTELKIKKNEFEYLKEKKEKRKNLEAKIETSKNSILQENKKVEFLEHEKSKCNDLCFNLEKEVQKMERVWESDRCIIEEIKRIENSNEIMYNEIKNCDCKVECVKDCHVFNNQGFEINEENLIHLKEEINLLNEDLENLKKVEEQENKKFKELEKQKNIFLNKKEEVERLMYEIRQNKERKKIFTDEILNKFNSYLGTQFDNSEDEIKILIETSKNNLENEEEFMKNLKEIKDLNDSKEVKTKNKTKGLKNLLKELTENIFLLNNEINNYETLLNRNLEIIKDNELSELTNTDELKAQHDILNKNLNTALNEAEFRFKKNLLISKKEEIEKRITLKEENFYDKKMKLKMKLNKLKQIERKIEEERIVKKQESKKVIGRLIELSNLNLKTEEINEHNSKHNLEELNCELEEINNNISASANAHLIYKSFQKLGIKKNECPLCKKSFNNKEKVEYVSKLENIILKIPEKKAEEELKKTEIIKSINKIHEQNEKFIKKQEIENEIEELKKNAANILCDCDYLIEVMEDDIIYKITEKELDFSEEKLTEIVNSLQNMTITSNIENIFLDILEEEENIKGLEELQKINEELNEIPELKNYDVQEIKKEIEEVNEKIKKCEEQIKINNLIIENKKICENLNKKKTEKEEMHKLYEKYDDELRNNDKWVKLTFETENLKLAISNIHKLKERLKIECGMLTDDMEGIKENIYENNIHNLNQLLILYDNSRDLLIQLKQENLKKSEKLILLKEKMKRNINCIKINENILKMKKLKETVSSLKNEEIIFLKDKLKSLKNKKNEIETEQSISKGELKQLNKNLKICIAELENEFKDVNKKYEESFIECKSIELILDDIEKCIKVLDKSIVEFHSAKLSEVNANLKDLWINTYKGNDIDFIEIKSESVGAKVYNYRIVMIKNGVELDMRGRSSAGQRVIASILIRLALSDSFSSNCSIMALDEPTTNLDKENIESLGFTLSKLITKRRFDKNFQLIVITHDEEFVNLLSRNGAEYFYRLRRDNKGDSYIDRHVVY